MALNSHSQLLVGFGDVMACDLTVGEWGQIGYNISNNSDSSVWGLASITPQLPALHRPVGPLPPSVVPPTALLAAIVNTDVANAFDPDVFSVLAVQPAVNGVGPPMPIAIPLPQGFAFVSQNCLAVWQKALPPLAELIQAPPVYVYVSGLTAAGGAILRYQMTPKLPYSPAGIVAADPTGTTFISLPWLTDQTPWSSLACSNAGTLAATDGSTVYWYDAETGQAQYSLEIAQGLAVFTLAYGPNGQLYGLAGPQGNLPVDGGTTILTITPEGSAPNLIADIPELGTDTTYGSAMVVAGTGAAPVIYVCVEIDSGPGSGSEFRVVPIDGNTLKGVVLDDVIVDTVDNVLPPKAIGFTTFYTWAGPPL